jgi:hypothetical protein
MEQKWKDSLAWLSIASAAVLFAFATPSGQAILGRVPQLIGSDLNQRPVSIPAGLTAERTLVLVSFQRGQGRDVDTWIRGMSLRDGGAVQWVRLPILNDPGDSDGRNAVANRFLAHYASPQERSKVIPVFTDQQAFLRSVGLSSTDQISALVLNRNGEVLARVEGSFSPDKKGLIEQALVAAL